MCVGMYRVGSDTMGYQIPSPPPTIPFNVSMGTPTSRNMLILGAIAKFRKATVSFVMSARTSAWNNLVPTGRIFMKCYI
jgi:hypothetical protein